MSLQVFSGHSGPVTAGAFTPDGKHVVSVGGDNDCSLRVWNPKTGECVSTLQGHPYHQEGITCLGVHQDGSVVITGAQDGSVAVSNIHNSRVVASLHGEGGGCARERGHMELVKGGGCWGLGGWVRMGAVLVLWAVGFQGRPLPMSG
jgi:ribosome assembly protein SQT1